MFVTPITSCAALMAPTAQAPNRAPADKMKKLLHAQNMIADAPSQRAKRQWRAVTLFRFAPLNCSGPNCRTPAANDKHAATAIVHSIVEVGDRTQPEEAKHSGEPPEVVNGIDAEGCRRGAAGIEVPADEFLEEMGCSCRRERQRQIFDVPARCSACRRRRHPPTAGRMQPPPRRSGGRGRS